MHVGPAPPPKLSRASRCWEALPVPCPAGTGGDPREQDEPEQTTHHFPRTRCALAVHGSRLWSRKSARARNSGTSCSRIQGRECWRGTSHSVDQRKIRKLRYTAPRGTVIG